LEDILLKAVLFDMDGVLVDSEPEYRRIERILFHRVGISPTEEEIKGNSGKGQAAVWKEFKERYKFAEDPQELVKAEALMISVYYGSKELAMIEPSVELLKRCSDGGLKVAVATSSIKENAEIVIKTLKIERYVDAVAAGDMVEYTKPSPDIFLLAAELLGVGPNECVVVEDATNGVNAAKAAGISVVGFKAPGSGQDLSKADIVVDTLGKINIDTLRALLGD
jgi:HAD superfamily hydrolase (TIGR01509 family)